MADKYAKLEPADSGAAAERLSNFQSMMDRRNFVLSLAGCAAGHWLPQMAKNKTAAHLHRCQLEVERSLSTSGQPHESKVSA